MSHLYRSILIKPSLSSILKPMAQTLPRYTVGALRSASKQSQRLRIVPVTLRRAIKKFIKEQEEPHMRRKVLRLSQQFSDMKDENSLLPASTYQDFLDDPKKGSETSKRWKLTTSYGDNGLVYTDDETNAYIASRMPAVNSALYRVLSEVSRRLPGFAPAKVLDFGAGTGSAFWAMREIWPRSIERVNLIEPSQSMQRAGQRLINGLKNLPIIQSYPSIQELAKKIKKSDRKHDIVIASYVLGEIPSLKDRISVVRQLWELTDDVLVLVEPGTPQGSKIISTMRSHILWMEKRKNRKAEVALNKNSKELMTLGNGAFIVAPCPHDGPCPLENTDTYCHFVQRLQRTTSQRAYKRSGGKPLRGFEDEKFSYVAFKRGERPRGPWPLDGMEFDTLKEQHAKRKLEDLEIDFDDQFESEDTNLEDAIVPVSPVSYESDTVEGDTSTDINESNEDDEEVPSADLGSGWGRIVFMPFKRGKLVEMDVCRSVNREGTEGSFDRIVVTKSRNPTLHEQARKSMWGDLWPF